MHLHKFNKCVILPFCIFYMYALSDNMMVLQLRSFISISHEEYH